MLSLCAMQDGPWKPARKPQQECSSFVVSDCLYLTVIVCSPLTNALPRFAHGVHVSHFPAAWVFDLDGTLVQTETLKADSYHEALSSVVPTVSLADVHAHYRTVVGRSGEEVARSFVERFTTPESVGAALEARDGEAAWATLYRVRRAAYARLVEDATAIRRVACPFNRGLLERIQAQGGRVALATMSHRPQVNRVLDVLGLDRTFEVVATRDDVDRGKPDPEIYHRVFERMGVSPDRSAIVEDSPSGAMAALASGAHVIVVVNDLTRDAITRAGLPTDRALVVESDPELQSAVEAWRVRASR